MCFPTLDWLYVKNALSDYRSVLTLDVQTATFAVGKALNNTPIKILGCVMTCLLICVWMFVFGMMIRAVACKQILWPQKQEDRDEGGWLRNAQEGQYRDAHRDLVEASPAQVDHVEPEGT